MAQFTNLMEVLQLLDKSNCRKCGEKTCMAFAGAVFTGKRKLHECPTIPAEQLGKYDEHESRKTPLEEENEKILAQLKSDLLKVDLKERAQLLGASYIDDRLSFQIMGKSFSIDQQGNAFTDLHVNSWILATVLNYINYSKALPVRSDWLPLRELPSGKDWYRLFHQQSEKILKKTADNYPDLFSDLVQMFSGKQVNEQFKSDVAVVLSPLPLVPMAICYWKEDEGLESALGLFFDQTAEDNLGIGGLYSLGVGFAFMIEKLARQHAFG